MPGGDRTGPMGMGPLTGGGFGYCADARQGGYNAGMGRRGGRCLGRGGGRGGFGFRNTLNSPWGYRSAPRLDKADETKMLTEQAVALKEELKAVQDRLSALESEGEKE